MRLVIDPAEARHLREEISSAIHTLNNPKGATSEQLHDAARIAEISTDSMLEAVVRCIRIEP